MRAVRKGTHGKRRFKERCDHSARRPRQDYAGGRHASSVGHFPRQSAGADLRHGFGRARARARHHHPRKEHVRALGRGEDQHHRHPGTRRFLGRGGARAQDGERGHTVGGCGGRSHAPDPLRRGKGAGTRAQDHHRRQQDRPPRREAFGGGRRSFGAPSRPRRGRRTAHEPHPLLLGQERHGDEGLQRAGHRPEAPFRCSSPPSTTTITSGASA